MLDKSKPYGTICGTMNECPEARYSQDGMLFNARGDRVGGDQARKDDSVGIADAGPVKPAEQDSVTADLEGMSDDELRAFAKDVFNHEFHHRTKADKMRQTIADMMRGGD